MSAVPAPTSIRWPEMIDNQEENVSIQGWGVTCGFEGEG
jgi:hypothetical protein